MEAKYAVGTKVRINVRDSRSKIFYSEVALYQDQIGEILGSITVVGYLIPRPWSNNMEALGNPAYPVRYYTIRLDNQTTLQYVTEDCLEPWAEVML